MREKPSQGPVFVLENFHFHNRLLKSDNDRKRGRLLLVTSVVRRPDWELACEDAGVPLRLALPLPRDIVRPWSPSLRASLFYLPHPFSLANRNLCDELDDTAGLGDLLLSLRRVSVLRRGL